MDKYDLMGNIVIKGPDSPTSQLPPTIRKSGCSGTEKEEKTKEMVDGQSF